MKKTLIALAVLGAGAASVQAGGVQLYGSVDGGFQYTHIKTTTSEAFGKTLGFDGSSNKTSSFKMADGLNTPNKFGIKGVEDISSDLRVGFVLENGFHLANGALADEEGKKLFDREAQLYIEGAFGRLGAGRMGGLTAADGSYDTFFSVADAFDGGDNAVPFAFVKAPVLDNTLVYQSPEFAGLQATAMYSFNTKGDQANKFKDNTRYAAFGVNLNQDKFQIATAVEGIIPSNEVKAKEQPNGIAKKRNTVTFSIGGNVDFDVAKVFAGAQITRHADFNSVAFNGDMDVFSNVAPVKADMDATQVKGYAGTLGTVVPVGQGDVTVAGYLGNYKAYGDSSIKYNSLGLAARYTYNLSKRTAVYAGAGMGRNKVKGTDVTKQSIAQVYMGLSHNF